LVRKGLILFLSLTLVATFLLMGCAKKAEKEAKVEKKEVLIVVHTSLTGGLADYGYAAAEACKLAKEDFSPFKVGNTEYTIRLEILDDKGEPGEAAVVAQRAVDMGATAVIGCLTSGNSNAAIPIYKKANIPMISGSATNPQLTESGHKNFFRTCLRDDLQGKAIGEWAIELGYKKVVVMDDKGDYAVGLADEVEKTLKDAGVETNRQHCQEGDTDFSAQVNNIKTFGADAVIFTGYHREAGLLRKQMVEAGLKDVAFMGGDGIKSEEIFKEAGSAENMEGAMCTFGSLSQEEMPGFEEFKKKYKDATGKDPGPYSENNYDALGILVEAIKKAGSLDGEKIIEALHEVEYSGVMGTFGFDEKGDIAVEGKAGTEAIPRFIAKNGAWVPYEK
jgi:branched-chain amino acid transport system substrate-binding protein